MGGGSMRSSTETLIEALRILAGDILSEEGVANAAIAEAADRMEELCSELLFQKQLAEKYVEAGKICAKIYMARNITLSEESMLSAIAEIDKIYRTQHDGN
jgi:hypothetical protein